jgi:site-specific recombinase XerD
MNIGKYVGLYSKDLMLKNYADNSIKNYCLQVSIFLKHHSSIANKPTEISEIQIKDWLLETNSINGRKHRLSALKLFYKLTIGQPLKFKNIEYPRSEKKLPIVLSVAEVQRMFDVCENRKHKVILSLLYSCGLRVSELINLRWCHLDRSRGVINIIKAKGSKDRQVMLPSIIVPLLEKYYLEYTPKDYVLNGQFGVKYSARSVGEVVKQLASKARIENKRVYTHLMRHCSFTHMVESGIDINLIQKLAGHSSVKTTAIYTHISHNLISSIQSPISGIRI